MVSFRNRKSIKDDDEFDVRFVFEIDVVVAHKWAHFTEISVEFQICSMDKFQAVDVQIIHAIRPNEIY